MSKIVNEILAMLLVLYTLYITCRPFLFRGNVLCDIPKRIFDTYSIHTLTCNIPVLECLLWDIPPVHSKNTRVKLDPEKGPLGPNYILGQRWPGNQSTWRRIWSRAGSIWPRSLSSLHKAQGQFRAGSSGDPVVELGPNGPLSESSLTRVC